MTNTDRTLPDADVTGAVGALTTELTAYCRVLKNTRSSDDIIVRLLDTAITTRDLRTLRAAKAACDALPREECRQFHHGWDMDGHRPSRDELLRSYAKKPVRRFLQLDGWGPGDCDDVIKADSEGYGGTSGISFELRNTHSPVRVLVHEGSARATVLALLTKITNWLARDWDQLVTTPEPRRELGIPAVRAEGCPPCGEPGLPF